MSLSASKLRSTSFYGRWRDSVESSSGPASGKSRAKHCAAQISSTSLAHAKHPERRFARLRDKQIGLVILYNTTTALKASQDWHVHPSSKSAR